MDDRCKLIAYDCLRDIGLKQKMVGIDIDLGYPFSEVTFCKKNFEIASELVALKFLGGFNESCNREIYLNKEIIKNEDLLLGENYEKFESFINVNNTKLKEENNKFTIKIKEKGELDGIIAYVVEFK